MKKIARIITPLFIIAALLVVPLGVQAQVIDIPADDDTSDLADPDPLPSTGAPTPAPTPTAAPDTGFGPSDNKVVANLSIFMIGGLLGAGFGYGFILLRKKLR